MYRTCFPTLGWLTLDTSAWWKKHEVCPLYETQKMFIDALEGPVASIRLSTSSWYCEKFSVRGCFMACEGSAERVAACRALHRRSNSAPRMQRTCLKRKDMGYCGMRRPNFILPRKRISPGKCICAEFTFGGNAFCRANNPC